jgi:hypothetical protein
MDRVFSLCGMGPMRGFLSVPESLDEHAAVPALRQTRESRVALLSWNFRHSVHPDIAAALLERLELESRTCIDRRLCHGERVASPAVIHVVSKVLNMRRTPRFCFAVAAQPHITQGLDATAICALAVRAACSADQGWFRDKHPDLVERCSARLYDELDVLVPGSERRLIPLVEAAIALLSAGCRSEEFSERLQARLLAYKPVMSSMLVRIVAAGSLFTATNRAESWT